MVYIALRTIDRSLWDFRIPLRWLSFVSDSVFTMLLCPLSKLQEEYWDVLLHCSLKVFLIFFFYIYIDTYIYISIKKKISMAKLKLFHGSFLNVLFKRCVLQYVLLFLLMKGSLAEWRHVPHTSATELAIVCFSYFAPHALNTFLLPAIFGTCFVLPPGFFWF